MVLFIMDSCIRSLIFDEDSATKQRFGRLVEYFSIFKYDEVEEMEINEEHYKIEVEEIINMFLGDISSDNFAATINDLIGVIKHQDYQTKCQIFEYLKSCNFQVIISDVFHNQKDDKVQYFISQIYLHWSYVSNDDNVESILPSDVLDEMIEYIITGNEEEQFDSCLTSFEILTTRNYILTLNNLMANCIFSGDFVNDLFEKMAVIISLYNDSSIVDSILIYLTSIVQKYGEIISLQVLQGFVQNIINNFVDDEYLGLILRLLCQIYATNSQFIHEIPYEKQIQLIEKGIACRKNSSLIYALSFACLMFNDAISYQTYYESFPFEFFIPDSNASDESIKALIQIVEQILTHHVNDQTYEKFIERNIFTQVLTICEDRGYEIRIQCIQVYTQLFLNYNDNLKLNLIEAGYLTVFTQFFVSNIHEDFDFMSCAFIAILEFISRLQNPEYIDFINSCDIVQSLEECDTEVNHEKISSILSLMTNNQE